MNCRLIRNEIKAYIDGELKLFTRWRVERHLRQCTGCREEMHAMMDLTNDVKNTPTTPTPEGLRNKVMGRLEFEPQSSRRRAQSPRTVPVGVAALVLLVIVAGAAIFPTMQTAKNRSNSARHAKNEIGAYHTDEVEIAVPKASKPATVAPQQAVTSPALVAQSPTPANLMIIKTTDLSVRVTDFQDAYNRAVSIAKSVGGFITDSSAETDGDSPTSGIVTVRVPVDDFERVLERLAALGKVQNRSINGEDVTAESVDLESRLRNKRSEERQYLDIMNRAKKVGDVVTVSNELYRVRGEIEEIQGRLKYLKNASAMSSINLTLSEKEKPKPKADSGLGRTFRDAVASLVNTAKMLAAALIWLLVYAPVWAISLLGTLYVRKRMMTQDA